jgi:hypothetical protein
MAALFSQDTRGVGDFNERGLYINWTLNRKEDEVRLGEARNQTLVILVICGTIVLAVVISG